MLHEKVDQGGVHSRVAGGDGVYSDKRFQPRIQSRTPAIIVTDVQRWAVEIRNVNFDGVGVSGIPRIEAGQLVKLVLGGWAFEGIVRWSREGSCGIAFASAPGAPTSHDAAILSF